jgi:uncharacterized protein YndB with AHSA1/START domain
MKTKDIKQVITINASPKKVYDALMKDKLHKKFTGAPAKISPKVGGAFSCYGGYIKGFNLELKKGKLIVQAWRSQDWPGGFYSLVTFKLSPESKGKTKLTFIHAGVPADDYSAKSDGWYEHYWNPLQEMLEA